MLCLQAIAGFTQPVLNALSFDGVDDEVVISGGSSLIAGGSGLSMAFWVFPENTPTGFPDFDGMAGFRNNFDADFYVLQLSATDIEARFRPASGVNTDIIFNGLQLSQWQHIAFTFNGTEISLYHNGILVSTLPASGGITNSFADLVLGNLYFQGTPFNFQGKLDDFLLLDRALTQNEITCLASGDVDTTLSGLKLYYGMNQGSAGGLNTGLSTLNGLNGQSAGTLNNFALTDSSSNWVEGISFVTEIQGNVCTGSQYLFLGLNYGPGNYWVTEPNGQGCRNHYYLTVTETTVNIDTALTVSGNTLSSNASGVGYQWVNCNNNFAAIPNAVNSTFSPSAAGSYACILSQSGCYDTTRCVSIGSASSVEEIHSHSIKLYPVPANESVRIELPVNINGTMVVTDISGRVIYSEGITGKTGIIQTSAFAEGIYQMLIIHQEGSVYQQTFSVMRN